MISVLLGRKAAVGRHLICAKRTASNPPQPAMSGLDSSTKGHFRGSLAGAIMSSAPAKTCFASLSRQNLSKNCCFRVVTARMRLPSAENPSRRQLGHSWDSRQPTFGATRNLLPPTANFLSLRLLGLSIEAMRFGDVPCFPHEGLAIAGGATRAKKAKAWPPRSSSWTKRGLVRTVSH